MRHRRCENLAITKHIGGVFAGFLTSPYCVLSGITNYSLYRWNTTRRVPSMILPPRIKRVSGREIRLRIRANKPKEVFIIEKTTKYPLSVAKKPST